MRDVTSGFAVAAGIGDDVVELIPFPVTQIIGNDAVNFVVPGNEVWEVLSFVGTLSTNVTVATRQVACVIDNGTTTVARAVSATVQTASLTLDYTAFPGAANAGSNVSGAGSTLPIPTIALAPGWRVRWQTLNFQGTDGWSKVTLTVRRRVRDDHPLTADDTTDLAGQFEAYEHAVEQLRF